MIAGIDIGGTSTKIGLVRDDRVIDTVRIATAGHDADGTAPGSAFADAITMAVRGLQEKHGLVRAAGIGAPNGNQHTGTIDRAPNLPWKSDVPLASMLTERLGVPCTLGNDANAAALGEWRYGAGRGCNDLLVVTLGTGLGSGIITGGKLLLGPYGNAGELGHTTLVMDGRLCTCGRKGCLETYVSIRGMRQTYLDLADSSEPLKQEGVLPIAEQARLGEDAAIQTFRDTARWLSIGLANAVAFTVPKRIVLFGGIARNGDLLMSPLMQFFEKDLFYIYHGKVELMLSALPEDDAGILGAAALTALAD
ncbi:MAG: ROK family protein [Flavobacteriales bacterium]|nr:ROK family protein [Flavobacteriales bacterium]